MRNITIITCSLLATLSMYGRDQHSRPLVPPVNPIQPVLNVLKEAKAPGSLEFFGKCESFVYPGFPDFPPIVPGDPTAGSPVQKLRSIFSRDPSMQINQLSDGRLQLIEDNIPQDILNIKIADINFSANGRYVNNPNGAVQQVLYSPEVQNFVTLHSIKFPYPQGGVATGIFGGIPNPAIPRISAEFHDVTVEFLLNEIAKTFQNLWIYENCPTSAKGSRVIYIRFYQP
jgi:hypothetical protein